ncbi:MAG TPA: hypothetical protein VMH77_02500 [Steroidobacteraceae bacterium]|nr:hypothetical protein [Steroidobacteraceae bacterium]
MARQVALAPVLAVSLVMSGWLMSGAAAAQRSPASSPPLGSQPPADALPRPEFVFEERVTLAPATVLGDSAPRMAR